jgi:hypothetical protein
MDSRLRGNDGHLSDGLGEKGWKGFSPSSPFFLFEMWFCPDSLTSCGMPIVIGKF